MGAFVAELSVSDVLKSNHPRPGSRVMGRLEIRSEGTVRERREFANRAKSLYVFLCLSKSGRYDGSAYGVESSSCPAQGPLGGVEAGEVLLDRRRDPPLLGERRDRKLDASEAMR